ncbi:hypothetical protein NDW01_42575 [Actinoallomurus sp. WRP6H-15]|nr:hypothetical protein [Actinoallomurus soli]MCO5975093.1 hypothetical protein [Actinoallomurus soli]
MDEVAFHLSCHRGGHEQHLVGDGLPVGSMQSGADPGEDLQVHVPGMELVLHENEAFRIECEQDTPTRGPPRSLTWQNPGLEVLTK